MRDAADGLPLKGARGRKITAFWLMALSVTFFRHALSNNKILLEWRVLEK
jgi:hypothetical protein